MARILVGSSGTSIADTQALEMSRRNWSVPLALVALSGIPLVAGTFRLVQLGGGPEMIPAYALVGVLQVVPGFRRRHWDWHRRAGRALTAAGLLVVGSALWMTLGYAQKPGTGDLLQLFRLTFGSGMAISLVLGVRAIQRRDVRTHRAWMIRAYAIGLAAGSQVFTEGIGGALFGTGVLAADLQKGAGWVVNLAVAEWVIRRRPRSPALHMT